MSFQPTTGHDYERWEDVPRRGTASRIRCVKFNFFNSLAQHSQAYLDMAAQSTIEDKELPLLIQRAQRNPAGLVSDGRRMFNMATSHSTSFSIDLDVNGWGSNTEGRYWDRIIITTPDFAKGDMYITHNALMSIAQFFGAHNPEEVVQAVRTARKLSNSYKPQLTSAVAAVYLGNFRGDDGIYRIAANLSKIVNTIHQIINAEPYAGSKHNMWLYALLVRIAFVHSELTEEPLTWFEQAEFIYSRKLSKMQRDTLSDELKLAASIKLSYRLAQSQRKKRDTDASKCAA